VANSMPPDHGRMIVIGAGNPERGDDAAGRAVVRLLRGTLPDEVALVELDGEATALLAHFEDVETAFIVDACASGLRVGSLQRFDVSAEPLPQATFSLSTHGFGLAEGIELARALDQLPERCIVYAIEGNAFEAGAPLSPQVAAAVTVTATRLRAEITGSEERRESSHA